MGLDQYAYAAARAGQRDKWYEGSEYNKDLNEWVNTNMARAIELAYWRKHPNLHGWMEQLWLEKLLAEGVTPEIADWDGGFNGIELELTHEDIECLEKDILNDRLRKLETTGFFFGNPSDDHYREQDLEFCRRARAELFCGLKVFYNSSW